MMTQARLADVIDEFSFNGTISRTQIEMAVPLADCLDRGADPDALIVEALEAGIITEKYDPEDVAAQPGMVSPNRPMSFEVVHGDE